jgi:hypothetical protein
MVEVLLLLLAYALLLDCALRKASVDVGALPSVVRRRALAGLLRPRPRAAVVAGASASRQGPRAVRRVPGGRL